MRKTILVADDSPTIQRLVAETFADGDYDIVAVSNGDAAIRKLDELHPDVILADVYMPGKNGFELCSFIKHHQELSEAPVILLAGAFDVFDENAALEAGASSSITKPFEPRVLVDMVASVIAAAAERAASRATPTTSAEESDLLGLGQLFKPAGGGSIGDDDLERIADRVLQKVSTQLIESVAWNVVPDIAEKILREEVKRARSNET